YDDVRRAREHDALAIEMEAAALFALGSNEEVPVACVLAVSDTFDARGARTRIDDHLLRDAAESMGALALRALGGSERGSVPEPESGSRSEPGGRGSLDLERPCVQRLALP